MEGVIVQAVAEYFRINASATGSCVFKFFDNQRPGTFSHDEAITQTIKWPARQSGVASPAAHGLNKIECAKGKRGQRRFRSTRHDHIGEIVADVAQGFANRDGTTGATVGISGANPAKPKFNCDIGMGGAAEDLKGQRRIHSARSFFQKANVLIFSLANSAERSPETDADAVLRLVTGIFQACVIEREFSGSNGELGVAIQSLQTVRREKFFGCPIANFAGTTRIKTSGIESGNVRDSAAFR